MKWIYILENATLNSCSEVFFFDGSKRSFIICIFSSLLFNWLNCFLNYSDLGLRTSWLDITSKLDDLCIQSSLIIDLDQFTVKLEVLCFRAMSICLMQIQQIKTMLLVLIEHLSSCLHTCCVFTIYFDSDDRRLVLSAKKGLFQTRFVFNFPLQQIPRKDVQSTNMTQAKRRSSMQPIEIMEDKLRNLINSTTTQKAWDSIKYMISLFK